jgi:putative membrane protein
MAVALCQETSVLSPADKTFLTKVAEGGKKEIAVATAAMSSTTNPEVKSFARRIIDDHTRANHELETLAQSKGVSPASSTESAKTEKQEGSDKAFLKDMVKDHEKDIAMFERESRHGSDAEVKEWAAKTIPTLQEHLSLARSLQASLMGTDTSSSKP